MRPRSTRLLTALCSATLVLAAVLAHVHASAGELALEAGRPLLAYANAATDEGLRTLVINGARLRMRAGTTLDSIDEVLDRQAQECPRQSPWLNALVRTRRTDQGFIGCIVPSGSRDLLERLRSLGETGDLAELGELRVTWVMLDGAGVRYVALASEGKLVLRNMFPARRDAPGVDVPGAPRPMAAQRIVSSWQDGAEPMLVSYRSAHALEEVEARYTRDLAAAGLHVERAPQLSDGESAWLLRDAERVHLAVLARDGEGTLISIIPLASAATRPPLAR